MLKENALVVRSQGSRAWVRTQRTEACAGCSAASACKTLGGGKQVEVEVINHIRAQAGERVELELPESSFLIASTITYALPLTCLVGGAVIGKYAGTALGFTEDIASMAMAGLGLVLSIPGVVILNRAYNKKEKNIPRITRVLPPLPTLNESAGTAEACGE